jgi:Glycosyl transferase family 2
MGKLGLLLSKLIPSDQREAAMAATIHELSMKVERYRSTDEKRQALHRKIKDRLKEVKAESKLVRREAREARKALEEAQRENAATQQILTQLAPVLSRRGGAGAGETCEDLLDPKRYASLREKAWRPWMRLGVLEQHAPRPLAVPGPPRRHVADPAPRLSIVTPSYQQAPFLKATLDSVLDQQYPQLEYIVMDGGSTDGSAGIIESYAPRLHYWQSQRDGGHSAALIDGFSRCSGDIMAWLNSDDLFLPGTLAYVVDYFNKNPQVDAVYGHRVLINEAGHEVGRWYLPPHDGTMLLWADYIPQETWFWRRRSYEKCGGIDASMRFAMDWDLLLKMQRAGAVFHRLPEFLGAFRVHKAQKSQAIINEVGAVENAFLRKRELGHHFNQADLERRSTAFQYRALRTMRLWNLGLRSVKF